jgi:galactose mutarotase-like enzyme
MIGARLVDGFEALTIGTPAEGGIEAAFVPGAGMVGCSLRHRGEELLGQRRGLRAYVEERATMGIPLLYPWANRVAHRRFSVAGRDVVIDPEATPLRLDAAGLPMHGLLSAARGWEVERHEPVGDGAVLAARFHFAAHDALMAAFPFAHELRMEASLAGARLTIATMVQASGDAPVPIAFGYHPYLRLPGLAREDWRVEVPVREQLRLDSQMLPTGERVSAEVHAGRLGARTFDDAFVAPEDGAPFVLAGGDRRIELAFVEGFPYAQVFAPAQDDVIAFEPMTAPTNALVDGGAELPLLAPGESYRASFSITLADGA